MTVYKPWDEDNESIEGGESGVEREKIAEIRDNIKMDEWDSFTFLEVDYNLGEDEASVDKVDENYSEGKTYLEDKTVAGFESIERSENG